MLRKIGTAVGLRLRIGISLVVIIGVATTVVGVGTAFAGAGWELSARTEPTNLSPLTPSPPLVSGMIAVDVFNTGSSAAGCTAQQYNRETLEENRSVVLCPQELVVPGENTITITDRLPTGLTAEEAGEVTGTAKGGAQPSIGHAFWSCTGNGPGEPPNVAGATAITCTNKKTKLSGGERELGAFAGGGGAPTLVDSLEGAANPQPELGIAVNVQAGAAEHETNHVSIAGGGASASASTADPVTVSSASPGFEVVNWDGWFSNADGTIDTQAGSHPYEAVFSLALASELGKNGESVTGFLSGGEIKSAEVELPPGFIGDPTAVPECSRQQFDAEQCPLDTMIGTTTVYPENLPSIGLKVFNLVPPQGVPAEFGFTLQNLNTYLDASVRSGSDYGVTEHVSAIAHKEIEQAITTLWGYPGDPSHKWWRNGDAGGCERSQLETSENSCTTGLTSFNRPLLTLPVSCGGALPFTIRATSWSGTVSERTFYSHDNNDVGTVVSGCDNLSFSPLFKVSPELGDADSASGLSVDVQPPLGGLQEAEGLSSSDIKNTSVVLPRGLAVNPGQAAGLVACDSEQEALGSDGPASCPEGSRIGTAHAKSPLIEGAVEKELEGGVYVLQSNPPQLKLLAALSGDGVNVKLVLNAELSEQTGQITTKVLNAPQLPVSDFSLTFDGGARASVVTPTHCGTFEASGDFTPWSTPVGSDFDTSAAFGVTTGSGGGGCPSSPLPFAPALTAGVVSPIAGGFTAFSTVLARGDGQQRLGSFSFTAPPGLAGMLSSVPLCGEPQAQSGACSPASLIGHAIVESGPGPDPLTIPQPGEPEPEIFLTGPYKGAPFGLSIVTQVIAGPFNLGTIVTRGRIEVNPHTAQISVTTDPLPQIIDGVPSDLREVDAVIDRPGFMFNPTSCTASSFSGTATGAPAPGEAETAVTSPISTRFQVGGCQGLQFAPKLTASTPAQTTKLGGAGLSVKLSYPVAQQGSQANISLAKVDLPKQLPSRLSTLHEACLAAVFEANPAGCLAHSIVGHAVVHTPVLPVPLMGPAYFVSHGGEAFPSLTIVLQGDGVTVDLVGSTLIKKGVTSNTFKSVPDVPFSTFELALPQGAYSALAAYLPANAHASFCGQKLAMPTEFTAQNGLEIHTSTPIAVTGCKKATKAQKLAAALKTCRKSRKKAKRASCEASARRKYPTVKKVKKTAKGSHR